MFKSHKQKSAKVGEKFDFQFSDFQAIKVPRGWDKLIVSITSHDTGKTIVKSGKASSKNGVCKWTETFRESVIVSQEKGEGKELQGCLVKFAVVMGSSGILGEVTINLIEYTSSRTSVPLSFMLNRCNYGTSLQFKVQCLTPKAKNRVSQSKQTNEHNEYGDSDFDIKCNASDGPFPTSGALLSGNYMEITSTSHAGLSRDPSLSASDSLQSSDSIDASSGNDMFSPQNNLFGPVINVIGRQDSVKAENRVSYSFCATDDDNRPNHSSVHSRAVEPLSSFEFQQEVQNLNGLPSPHSKTKASEGLLEAAEVTIEELRAEARMWERHAKKLTLDVEFLKKEMSEQSRSQENLSIELLASQKECNGLNQEIECLKTLLELSAKKQNSTTDAGFETKDTDEIKTGMEEELKFHKERNADLTEQLQKTQESNIELLSILQELEAIIESQKSEIDNLVSQKLKLHESAIQILTEKAHSSDSSVESNKVMQLRPDPNEQFPVGINNITIQLQQLQETQVELESTIRMVEKSVEEKDREIERERDLMKQALSESESKWRLQVSSKEEEIMNLEAKLSKFVKDQDEKNLEVKTGNETDLPKEINVHMRKIEDLEKDYSKHTKKNLELLLTIKEPQDSLFPPDFTCGSSCGSHDDQSRCRYVAEVIQLRDQLEKLKHELWIKETLVEHAAPSATKQIQCPDLEVQLQMPKEKNVHLENEVKNLHVLVEQKIEAYALQQRIEQYEAKEIDSGELLNIVCSNPNNLSHILFELRKLLVCALKLRKCNIHLLNFSEDCSSICCFHDLELKCHEPLAFEEQLHVISDSLSKSQKCFEGECNRCKEIMKYAKDDTQEEENHETDNLKGYELIVSNKGAVKSDKIIQCDPGKEVAAESSEIKALKSDNLRKEEENEMLQQQLNTLEDQIASVRHENHELQVNIQDLERDKSSMFECLDELKKENMILSSSVESHISATKVLERLSSELGKGKVDLEQELCDLEKDNMQLSKRISVVEAQLRCLTNEKEKCLVELQHSESQSLNLHDEIRRLETEMETQKVEVKQKVQDMQNRWLEAHEECAYLKKANPKLESTAESLIEECTSLQKYNGELKSQNMELHARCTVLEFKLRDGQAKIAECADKVEALEAEFFMLVEEVSIKAKSLNSELDSLVIEDSQHREKVVQENISLNHMYMEKVIEVESYHRELVHLIDQISVAHNDPEALASQALNELSLLRAEKAKLELSHQELTGKFALSQSKLSILKAETEDNVKQLTGELTALRKSHEILMVNHESLLGTLERFKSIEEKHKSVINTLETNLKASEYEKLQLAKEILSLKVQLQRSSLIHAELLDLKTSLSEAKFEYERVKASFDLLSEDHEELKNENNSLVQKISSMQKSLIELENCQHSKVALEEKVLWLEENLALREGLCSQDSELKLELRKIKRTNGELQRKIKHLEQDQEQLQMQKQVMHDQMKSVGKSTDIDDDSTASVSTTRLEKPQFQILDCPNSDHQSAMQSLENELAEALEANEMYKDQLKRLLAEQNCSNTSISGLENNQSDQFVKRQQINLLSMEIELKDLRDKYFQTSLKYAEVEAQREELVLKLKSTNNRRWFS